MCLDDIPARKCGHSAYQILWLSPCDKIAQNRVLWLLYKCPKFHFSTLELLTCDNYWPVTIFWPCPKVVIISDKYCINIGCLYTKLEVFVDKRVRGCARTERGNRFRVQVLLHVWLILQLLCRPMARVGWVFSVVFLWDGEQSEPHLRQPLADLPSISTTSSRMRSPTS